MMPNQKAKTPAEKAAEPLQGAASRQTAARLLDDDEVAELQAQREEPDTVAEHEADDVEPERLPERTPLAGAQLPPPPAADLEG